jgi:hypothetical protein
MKKSSFFALIISGIFLDLFLLIQCGTDSPASPPKTPSQLDREVAGTWRYRLPYNADTTINIVLTCESTYVYKINVNINDVDTMEWENGYWFIVSDTVSKSDTVWMDRHNCHQINLQTHVVDPIDCGVDTAGIKVNITQVNSRTVWIIPLNDFANYMPPGILPPGVTLPAGLFFKD